jgi:hypothetical protein
MKIKDLFFDLITNTDLFYSLYRRQRFFDKLNDLSDEIISFLIETKFFYNKESYKSNIKKLNDIFLDIQEDYDENLDKKYYYKWLFSNPIDSGEDIKNRYKRLIRLGNKPTRNDGFDEFYKEMKELFIKIIDDLPEIKFKGIESYINLKEN